MPKVAQAAPTPTISASEPRGSRHVPLRHKKALLEPFSERYKEKKTPSLGGFAVDCFFLFFVRG